LAVQEVGHTATEVAMQLGISQASVSISVKRCEKIVMAEKLKFVVDRKL
jgi:DNA-binding transcriptional regulator GbsR (MarR family)